MTDTAAIAVPAKARWAKLSTRRNAVLERARDCAKLTIPGLLPPEGHSDQTALPTPYQSIGARGVNNLSSKLLLALLPPGSSCFRLRIEEDVAKQLGGQQSAIEEGLAQIERKVTSVIETSPVRPVTFEAISHLVVAGNVMLHIPDADNIRLFRLDQYAVLRDSVGHSVEAVALETVHPSTLEPSVLAAAKVDIKTTEKVDVYTVITWDTTGETYWQEINDVEIPGTRGTRPLDKREWLPLRWRSVPGQDYGRGHVEEYLGDLRSCEGLNESIVQFAAAAAKIVLLVRPNAVTDPDDIADAESGDVVTGNPEDLSWVQLEKYADFQVANSVAERLEQRLSHAFLLRSGVTRQAERVTAEEIREVAQELEDALGGVYTVLSQEFQLPFVRRLMASIKGLPTLPKQSVRPMIVTGFEALGRNHSLNRLRAFVADVAQSLGPQGLQRLNAGEVLTRLGTGYGIEDVAALVKTDEQFAQEQQASQQAALMEKAAAPLAGAAAKAVTPQ